MSSPPTGRGFLNSLTSFFSALTDRLTPSWLEGMARGVRFGFGMASILLTFWVTPLRRFGTDDQRLQEIKRLNRQCAERMLELVLSLKGYYVKAAQTLCGAGQFPAEFDEVFAVLLDDCPQEPFEVVQEIIEAELGACIGDIFEHFDTHAVAAASIAQVHFAKLSDGTEVAVKVQYPSVERFFYMDVATVSFAMQLLGMGSQVQEIFSTMQDQFRQEFDFTSEAGVMRELADNLLPEFGDEIEIPLPIDRAHPSCPASGGLCTPKVLVMERLHGTPIRKYSMPLMKMFAEAYGMTWEELKRMLDSQDLSKVDMNNVLVRRALHMGRVTECQSHLLAAGIKARNLASRIAGACAEGIFRIAIVNDLTLDEQWYVYHKTRELKEAFKNGEDLDRFRLQNREAAVYTIFMEDSTRTKESFRNAAEFHGLKVNVFDAKTSSFQKNETITDTIKMLCGYSTGQSLFVIRSKVEGVCRWLEEAISKYCKQRGFPRASFINAGDGRHEHPSQEMLDEFSFLEQKGWDTSSIHLALLGDLFHGRTVHSKVDGLRIYRKVFVDLVAPSELALPKMYEDRMVARGYVVRKFASIDDYLAQEKVAKIWYFTRLQLERMGDKVLEKSKELRKAVTMRQDFLDKLPQGVKFFHPLPRDARHPTLPYWLDSTELNGWDQQSQNGYFTRIVLLGMLGGHFGDDYRVDLKAEARQPGSPMLFSPSLRGDFSPTSQRNAMELPDDLDLGYSPALMAATDFIKEVATSPDITSPERVSQEVGLVPIANGIVIENLAAGQPIEQVWSLMYMVRDILDLHHVGGQGVRMSDETSGSCVGSGFIAVPDVDISSWDRQPLKRLAAMAPGSMLKVVKDGAVEREFRLQVPPRVYNFKDIACKNTACVSHPKNMQHEVEPFFERCRSGNGQDDAMAFNCKYCETQHIFWEIWNYDVYRPSVHEGRAQELEHQQNSEPAKLFTEVEAPRWAKQSLPVPVNGPKLSRLLYAVHGYEIFQLGLFNSDPHAGNVFMMPDGKLGLIDYGACSRLSKEQRTNIAKLLVAIADENDDAAAAMGNSCCACGDTTGFSPDGAGSFGMSEEWFGKTLSLTFRTEENKEVTVVFPKAPLGFRLAYKQSPLKVANINEKGAVKEFGLNVQPGWALAAVNGTSVMSCHHKVGAQIVKDAIKETFGEQKHGSDVPAAFWACGFRSRNQDRRLALLLAHVFFNRGPYPYDMNRLAPKVGMPMDVDLMTLDSYLRGGELDEIEEFPGHLVMLQRCAMVLSGLAMELGAGRLSSAEMLKPQALAWLEDEIVLSSSVDWGLLDETFQKDERLLPLLLLFLARSPASSSCRSPLQ
ncbi:pyrBI [Symbiodinium microadriaticum]|nr:pyrBI [Symbiodinium microadriaticum]